MPQLPSRESLESMKRTDLQKLCKDYGVKANLKSEALIDLLLDAAKPVSRHASTRRSVSAKHPAKSGPSRVSSIIIHDTDEESEGEQGNKAGNKTLSNSYQTGGQHNSPNQHPQPPAARAKKGKEQTRLGVGRPVLAGGAGPRAITRSLSVSKGKQGKGSVSMKPIEATIVEEVETEEAEQAQDNLPVVLDQPVTPLAPIEYLAEIDKRVADALRPLHEQVKSMKLELEIIQSLKAEVAELKAQIDDKKGLEEKVETLTVTVKSFGEELEGFTLMRDQVDQLKGKNIVSSIPSTPKLQDLSPKKRGGPSGFDLPSSLRETVHCQELDDLQHVSTSDESPTYPDVAPSMLGKRHRDEWTTGLAGNVLESEFAANDSLSDMQPSAKRARFMEDNPSIMETSNSLGNGQENAAAQNMEEEETDSALRLDRLRDSRADLSEPAPPTDGLPDFFSPSSASEISLQNLTTVMATAAQDQQPFAFSFPNMSSTPAQGMYATSFPYPEPPQSPSPARRFTPPLSRPQQGRSDVFRTFGFPPPGRPRATGSHISSGLGSGFINPAALAPSSDRDQPRPSSSAEDETQAGSEAVGKDADGSSGTETGANVAETKRTMYGTELEGDTRFGDFGVEGVGKNGKGDFWAGGRY